MCGKRLCAYHNGKSVIFFGGKINGKNNRIPRAVAFAPDSEIIQTETENHRMKKRSRLASFALISGCFKIEFQTGSNWQFDRGEITNVARIKPIDSAYLSTLPLRKHRVQT